MKSGKTDVVENLKWNLK